MKLIAATAASTALLLPAVASARPADLRGPAPAAPKPAPVIVAGPSSDSGFDWRDAGVGAGAAGGLVIIAAGGFAAAYRFRARLAR